MGKGELQMKDASRRLCHVYIPLFSLLAVCKLQTRDMLQIAIAAVKCCGFLVSVDHHHHQHNNDGDGGGGDDHDSTSGNSSCGGGWRKNKKKRWRNVPSVSSNCTTSTIQCAPLTNYDLLLLRDCNSQDHGVS